MYCIGHQPIHNQKKTKEKKLEKRTSKRLKGGGGGGGGAGGRGAVFSLDYTRKIKCC